MRHPAPSTEPSSDFRVLELFCGIGGVAAALEQLAANQVVAAVDISEPALRVYSSNFQHPAKARHLGSISFQELDLLAADLWWMSPPCQPFTRRGLRRDDQDPRSEALLHLIEAFEQIRPRYLALENVPGFADSRTHARLRKMLNEQGYQIEEFLRCPSELAIPNRRERFYLLASREGDLIEPDWQQRPNSIASFVDRAPDPSLWVATELLESYAGALDIVDLQAYISTDTTACFTAAYGRSPVRSGSYLLQEGAVRRFAPREVLRFLGFPESFVLPGDLTRRKAWDLAGNSVSVPVVHDVLTAIPALRPRPKSF